MGDPAGAGRLQARRPVVIVPANEFNRSRIRTVIAAAVTSNVRLVDALGKVLLPRGSVGLSRDSVVDVAQLVTLDKVLLTERIRRVPPAKLRALDEGLHLVLAL